MSYIEEEKQISKEYQSRTVRKKKKQGCHKTFFEMLKNQKVQLLEGYRQELEEELMTVKIFLETKSSQAMWTWRFTLQG